MMRNKLLFVSWDGPQTFYMEGLFMPIFSEIRKKRNIEFHVLQFTWANKERIETIAKVAQQLGIRYSAVPIYRKPSVFVGGGLTFSMALRTVKRYVAKHGITIVMPRSTFPALFTQCLRGVKIVFDADGLPIEERVDFSGLRKNGMLYKLMKTIETRMLTRADVVITRSKQAIDILRNQCGRSSDDFFVVWNGRNCEEFSLDDKLRYDIRDSLGIAKHELLIIYVGSLGRKYALEEMLKIYQYLKSEGDVKFLILTADLSYLEKKMREFDIDDIMYMQVEVASVSKYIMAADVGFALIYPTLSMLGASPTKLGEYLLCGLPVIASDGIGDSQYILEQFEECYLYKHSTAIEKHLPKIADFVKGVQNVERLNIRQQALKYFSLEAAAESYIKALDRVLV